MTEIDFFVDLLLEKGDANTANMFNEKLPQMKDTKSRDFLLFLAIWLRIPIFSFSAQMMLKSFYPFGTPIENVANSITMLKQTFKKYPKINNNNAIHSLSRIFQSMKAPEVFLPILSLGDPFLVESFIKGKEEMIKRKCKLFSSFISLDFDCQYAISPVLAIYFDSFVDDLVNYVEECSEEKKNDLENILCNVFSCNEITPLKNDSFLKFATYFSTGRLSFESVAFSGFVSYLMRIGVNISKKPFNHPKFSIEMMNSIQKHNKSFMQMTISKICSLKEGDYFPLSTLAFVSKHLNEKQSAFIVKSIMKQKEGIEKYCSTLYSAKVEPLSSIASSAVFIVLEDGDDSIALGTILSILICSERIFFKFYFCKKLFDYSQNKLTETIPILFTETAPKNDSFNVLLSDIIKYLMNQTKELKENGNEADILLILYAISLSEYVANRKGMERFTSAVDFYLNKVSGNPLTNGMEEFPEELKSFAEKIKNKSQIKDFFINAAKTRKPVVFDPKEVDKLFEPHNTPAKANQNQKQKTNAKVKAKESVKVRELHDDDSTLYISGISKFKFESSSEEEVSDDDTAQFLTVTKQKYTFASSSDSD